MLAGRSSALGSRLIAIMSSSLCQGIAILWAGLSPIDRPTFHGSFHRRLPAKIIAGCACLSTQGVSTAGPTHPQLPMV
ncbi:hypothetical protein B0T25DRAFT_199237 [Lasiosphaeria hispida]|uniref:Uncharacterized protein n=1 Tax=Lasiosphaeria hispida TaxID=260671 RepID=A0AAJ0ME12_9PEZI|nr:hypothetical protein B0T25DRAFT_199237 [Lasiosphaeria hispida]